MSAKIVKVFLSLLGVLAVAGASPTDWEVKGRLWRDLDSLIVHGRDYTIVADKTCRLRTKIADVKSQLERAQTEVPQILGLSRHEWAQHYPSSHIRVFITRLPIRSHVPMPKAGTHPEIYLPCWVVEQSRAPVLHEFTHLVLPQLGSMSLREGLADWVQFSLRPGRASSFVEASSSSGAEGLSSAVNEALSRNSWLLHWVGGPGIPPFSEQGERFDFYHLSRGFVTFLAETYSPQTVISLIKGQGQDAAYTYFTGASRSALLARWQRHEP